jgi:hypothetical protein
VQADRHAANGRPWALGRRPAEGTFRVRNYYCCTDRNGTATTVAFKGAAMATGVLISLLITFLVIILVLYLINMLPIDGRAKQIARIIVIVIGIISLLKYLAVF